MKSLQNSFSAKMSDPKKKVFLVAPKISIFFPTKDDFQKN